MKHTKSPTVRAWETMPVFPTKDSLADVVLQAETELPQTPNEMFTILMTYHNTLLTEQRKAAHSDPVVVGHFQQRG